MILSGVRILISLLRHLGWRRLNAAVIHCFCLAWLTSNSQADSSTPLRVVSINVCTDQLAMLLAKPQQLLSVSYMASDPESAVLHEMAQNYHPNHGLAEEIFLMKPDLILAGTYSSPATTSLLRRLGFQVEQFAPETSFDDVRENILRMGPPPN